MGSTSASKTSRSRIRWYVLQRARSKEMLYLIDLKVFYSITVSLLIHAAARINNVVSIRRMTSIFPVSFLFLEPSTRLQVPQCPFNGAAGQFCFASNRSDRRPAKPFSVGAIPKIHINQPCPCRQAFICIQFSIKAHRSFSLFISCRSSFLSCAEIFSSCD